MAIKRIFILTISILALSISVLRAEQGEKTVGSMMNMDQMMKQCRDHCQKTTDSINQAAEQLNQAKDSNDPAKMRSAIEKVQKPFTEMKKHMSMCVNMMDMMQKMHGDMGQMQMGEAGGKNE